MSEPEINLRIKANSEDAQKAVDDFKAKVDKATQGAYSTSKSAGGGAKGVGSMAGGVIGTALGGPIGGAIGSAIGGAAGSAGSAAANSDLANAMKASFKDAITYSLLPGLNQAISQMQGRDDAVANLKGELGPSAAFMSKEEIRKIAKPFIYQADLSSKAGTNVDEALKGWDGMAGFKEKTSVLGKGIISLVTGEDVINLQETLKELRGASTELHEGAKKYNKVFKEK